jgi:hypothetical protein
MAAKKTVYLNERGTVRHVRQTDIDKLKKAFQKMVEEYLKMKKQQGKFEDALGAICMMWSPWTIPHRWVASKTKELRQR